MNGINHKLLLMCAAIACTLSSCLQVETFVQEVFVYEPVGTQTSIADLKKLDADRVIEEEIYVQGVVTSTDKEGQYAQNIVFQDESGAINIYADLSSSNQLFPVGQKISVQCKGLMLGNIGGVLSLGGGISGEGLSKAIEPIKNRQARSSIYAVEGGSEIVPALKRLSDLKYSERTSEQELICVQGLFFQTNNLPFANAGGSSEQFRTLYDDSGESILLCTSDGATMAGQNLPVGKGSVTGIITYSNNSRIITIRTVEDLVFDPNTSGSVNIPGDEISPLMISEYYSNKGAYYIEVTNVGTEKIALGEYSLASDTDSDGNFINTVALDEFVLGPFGIMVYRNSEAVSQGLGGNADADYDPHRSNLSGIGIDDLNLNGNNQVALLKNGEVVDLLSSTGKFNWAVDRTLVRRPGIAGHSKPSDYTRADAGWINQIAGYGFNRGYHRYYETDPNYDTPATVIPTTILSVRGMEQGFIATPVSIKGRVTSDSNGGNVEKNVLYMQDESNRGIRLAFREGQEHEYLAGDEVSVELFGSKLEDVNGMLTVSEALISNSNLTGAPNEMPAAIEASVAQIENLQSMYIYIKDVQVQDVAIGSTYGSGSIASEDLFANEFFIECLETSSFASETVSDQSGIIKGIAGKSGDNLVMIPRNEDDLSQLQDERFKAITAAEISVAEMKAYPAGTITDNVRVTATVVSDNTEGNMAGNRIFVQDNTEGFIIQLAADNNYSFGQSLIIVLNGASVETENNFVVTPATAKDVVAVGAPDPSLAPLAITAAEVAAKMNMLVTIPDIEVSEADRSKRFDGTIIFKARGISKEIHVITAGTASWKGAYIPTATGTLTGLLESAGDHYILYPRKAEDLAGLPKVGTRLNGEKVVYFVPSTDPKADLFISETVMGDLDANGNILDAIARNKCNSKFIELYNPSANILDLHNYRVACIKYNNANSRGDVAYWQFPEGLSLAPGKTVVFKYVSSALGTKNTDKMTNTIWPKGYTGDANLKDGVTVDQDAVPGVILCLDARDYSKTIANSTKAFPCFDGNDILVVQKTTDGGASWTEIDRLFTLKCKGDVFTGGVAYTYLASYKRKPGQLGQAGNITDVSDANYAAKESNKNHNDFDSVQCDPATDAAAYWIKTTSFGDVSDLGVHTFTIE